MEKLTDEDYKAAAKFFDKAVTKDPNYAAAYAGLADVYTYQAYYGYSGREAVDKARTLARRALELDPRIRRLTFRWRRLICFLPELRGGRHGDSKGSGT